MAEDYDDVHLANRRKPEKTRIAKASQMTIEHRLRFFCKLAQFAPGYLDGFTRIRGESQKLEVGQNNRCRHFAGLVENQVNRNVNGSRRQHRLIVHHIPGQSRTKQNQWTSTLWPFFGRNFSCPPPLGFTRGNQLFLDR